MDSDERDDLLVRVAQLAGFGQAKHNGKGVGRMTGGMDVIRALGRLREAGYAAIGPQRGERVNAPGDELVRICLVPDVEDEAVFRGVDERMHGQDDLDGAERRRHMATRFRSGLDDLLANLLGYDAELVIGQQLEVGW